MKIVVERNIPFMDAIESVAEVVRLAPEDITEQKVKDADVLVVRTRTRCDASLLEGSSVKMVATATIGTDHINMQWCKSADIEVVSAPGCNAPAVAQYVFSSLLRVANRPLGHHTLGIVGVGHVGSIVERWARGLGMKVMLCDPPRQAAGHPGQWHSLIDLARQADIITFHTPMTRQGEHPTYHLADTSFFNSLQRAPIIINSSRGPVVNNDAWVDAIEAGVAGPAIVDCWEGEPDINPRLLEAASIATPHIAGYSFDGKARASQMVLDAICRRFLPDGQTLGCGATFCRVPVYIKASDALAYNPTIDSAQLKTAADIKTAFEQLRNTYKLRPEIQCRFNGRPVKL